MAARAGDTDRRDRSRGDRPTPWIETDAFWVLHFANVYETGEGPGRRIVVDFPWWSALGFGVRDGASVTGCLARATIDLDRGKIDLARVKERGSEFPGIDDRLIGRPHRFLTVVSRSQRPEMVRSEHDQLVRYDMASGASEVLDCGAVVNEVAFAPREGAAEELDERPGNGPGRVRLLPGLRHLARRRPVSPLHGLGRGRVPCATRR